MGNNFCRQGNSCNFAQSTQTVVVTKSLSSQKLQRSLPLPISPTKQISLPILSQSINKILSSKDKYFTKILEGNCLIKRRRFGEDIYEGEINSIGQPHGIGRMYKADGSFFIGNFLSGKADGEGIYIMEDGSYFQGVLRKNQADCEKGEYYCDEYVYEGGFKGNLFHGDGRQKSQLYNFVGTYLNGKRLCGQLKWWNIPGEMNQYCYYGKFDQNGCFVEDGVLKEPTGKYIGSFLNGKKHGEGVYRFNNDIKYQGSYANGVKEGRGRVTFMKSGQIIYEGGWKDNFPEGEGFKYDQKGKKIKTLYKNGINILLLKNPNQYYEN